MKTLALAYIVGTICLVLLGRPGLAVMWLVLAVMTARMATEMG